jgi:hypothetical protein
VRVRVRVCVRASNCERVYFTHTHTQTHTLHVRSQTLIIKLSKIIVYNNVIKIILTDYHITSRPRKVPDNENGRV